MKTARQIFERVAVDIANVDDSFPLTSDGEYADAITHVMWCAFSYAWAYQQQTIEHQKQTIEFQVCEFKRRSISVKGPVMMPVIWSTTGEIC